LERKIKSEKNDETTTWAEFGSLAQILGFARPIQPPPPSFLLTRMASPFSLSHHRSPSHARAPGLWLALWGPHASRLCPRQKNHLGHRRVGPCCHHLPPELRAYNKPPWYGGVGSSIHARTSSMLEYKIETHPAPSPIIQSNTLVPSSSTSGTTDPMALV
jgi:hypothetical protein